MRTTLTHARAAQSDLREGLAVTLTQLAAERDELETVTRRKTLAQKIADSETVSIAARYEAQHAQRVAVLEQRASAQRAEIDVWDAEIDAMTRDLKAAQAGVGDTEVRGGHHLDSRSAAEGPEPGRDEIAGTVRRAERDAAAETRLAELKRRFGR
ncbi:MAG: hypothetical protein NVS1B4_04320 [Gemmatimonadaceae bacterium]